MKFTAFRTFGQRFKNLFQDRSTECNFCLSNDRDSGSKTQFSEDSIKSNIAVFNYLKYYLNLGYPPQFAVLIDGAWGAGKTHFIKNVMNAPFLRERCIYISLFGVKKLEDIDIALLKAQYPKFFTKGADLSITVFRLLLSRANFSPDIDISKYLQKNKSEIYIFDDVERAALDIDEVLGYFSNLIEHESKKVIIIANEREIIEKEKEYISKKEKIIGTTLHFNPSFAEALLNYAEKIDNEQILSILTDRLEDVRTIFFESGSENLRILQQAIFDFDRFYSCLDERFRRKSNGLYSIFLFILAMALEIKSGKLGKKDIETRTSKVISLMNQQINKQKTPLDIAQDKYSLVDLYDQSLSNTIISELFFSGKIDRSLVTASLQQSSLFTEPQLLPTWLIIWKKQEYDEQTVAEAIADVEQKFRLRRYVRPGEILQIFGILIDLEKHGLIRPLPNGIVDEFEKYIQEIIKNKTIVISSPTESRGLDNYNGFGFLSAETPEFSEIIEKMRKAISIYYDQMAPEVAKKLVDNIKTEDGYFEAAITQERQDIFEYANRPILNKIDPRKFANVLFCLEPKRQNSIMKALHKRYGYGKINSFFLEERNWLIEVRDILLQRSRELSRVSEYRWDSLIKMRINSVLPPGSEDR